MTDVPNTSSGEPSKAKHVAERGTQAAGQAVSDVKGTAAEQAQRVASEANAMAGVPSIRPRADSTPVSLRSTSSRSVPWSNRPRSRSSGSR